MSWMPSGLRAPKTWMLPSVVGGITWQVVQRSMTA
jgi:hypothetical protein